MCDCFKRGVFQGVVAFSSKSKSPAPRIHMFVTPKKSKKGESIASANRSKTPIDQRENERQTKSNAKEASLMSASALRSTEKNSFRMENTEEVIRMYDKQISQMTNKMQNYESRLKDIETKITSVFQNKKIPMAGLASLEDKIDYLLSILD